MTDPRAGEESTKEEDQADCEGCNNADCPACRFNEANPPNFVTKAGTKIWIPEERAGREATERVNDKPPIHWKENDGWKRHPQSAEEWNWHDDPAGEGSKRSELRLNFAGDLADPQAPDQMATVLRIDLLRIMGRMHSAEAYKASKLAQLAAQPSVQRISNDWIEVKRDCVMPKEGEYVRVIVVDDNTSIGGGRNVYQDVWSFSPNQWWYSLDARQCVSHWKPLDWPSITAERGSK